MNKMVKYGGAPWRLRGLSLLMVLALLIASLAAFAVMPAAARTEQEIKAEMAQADKRIAEQQAEIARIRAAQTDQEKLLRPLQEQIKEIEAKARLISEEINRLTNAVNQLNNQIKALEDEMAETEARIDEIEKQTLAKDAQIKEMQKILQERLRKQYMDGPISNLQLLLSSPDLASMLTITEHLNREAEKDAQLRRKLEAEMAVLNQLKAELEQEQARLEGQKLELQKQSAEVTRQILQQDAEKKKLDREHGAISEAETEIKVIIDGLQRQSRDAQRILDEQRRNQERFARELDAIIAQKLNNGEIPRETTNNGKMVWPFPYNGCYITSHFGATRNRASPHKGVDISIGNKGKQYMVVAALDGVIAAYGFDRYMGNYVMIYHGYYAPKGKTIRTTYMHLASFDKSSVVMNARIQAGKSIGIMGSTGNSTGPHLHFQIDEIGANGGSTPVNPLTYVSNPYG